MAIQRDKLERSLGGIADMKKIPDMIFIVDTNMEELAVKEALRLNIPIVAIGGIKMDNYKKLLLNKANFLAISSYIWNNKKYKPLKAILKLK